MPSGKSKWTLRVALGLTSVFFGCGAPTAGDDAGVDSGVVTTMDSGTLVVDSGTPRDAGSDAGTAVDAGADAGLPVDAGADAGAIDSGVVTVDAGVDAGISCMPTDPIDPFGVDSDCDGADGEAVSTLYVSPTGLATNPGTAQQPVATLQQAITIARGNAAIRAVVIAASPTAYSGIGLGSLLASGVSVFGGYDATTWSRPMGLSTPTNATRLLVPRNGETVLGPAPDSGIGPRVAVASDLEISVDDTLPTPAGWLDSVVLVINNSPNLTLRRLDLNATDGGARVGAPDAGAPGVNGGNAMGLVGGTVTCSSTIDGALARNASTLSSYGGNEPLFVRGNRGFGPGVPPGGPSGEGGGLPATIASPLDPNVGNAPGTLQAEGGSADGGLQPTNPTLGLGGHTPALFIDDVGTIRHRDVPPTSGRLGSGGGAGRGCGIPNDTYNPGGGGGAGGCGGRPGVNGRPGGSSVGVVITGSPPLLESVRITVGNGGAGGDASAGGRGGNGGNGANGVGSCNRNGLQYSTGGGGGASAGGGGGGTGGNGGLSVGVLVRANAVPTNRLNQVSVTRGVGGQGGALGAGGVAGNPGAGGFDSRGPGGGVAAGAGQRNQDGLTGQRGLDGVSADTAVLP